MKKTMNMKKTFAAVLATAVAASASVAQNQELLESKVDSINAKRGLELGGSIRAVAQSSTLANDQDPTGSNKLPKTEKDEFVTGDIVFGFRPYESVRANAIVRFEAGMQEYFAAAAKSISVPWLNVEGNIGNSIYWVVGNFRQEISPLTLFNPGLDIMYEAQVFARKRYMAQKEQFIEGNQRNLQGANVQFQRDFGGALGEVRAQGLFARLNRTAVLDLGGAEGNVLPKDTVWGASQAANMDKWLAAANIELLPFSKKAYFGVTPMFIFDDEESFTYTYRRPGNNSGANYELQPVNPYELNPQSTFVASGRAGADFGSFIGNKDLTLDGVVEVAFSNDKVFYADSAFKTTIDEDGNVAFVEDMEGNPIYAPTNTFREESLSGLAVLLNLNAGYKTSAVTVKLAVDAVYNDSNWFNNAAQSPSFFAQRILNSDRDGNTVKYSVNSPLYSSFDALYNFNPKFSPVTTSLGTNDDAFKVGQTDSYDIADYNKNSWGTNVYTRNQLALLQSLADPALQMSLPNGLATSNRLGGRGTLTANIKDFAEVQAMASFFQQVSGITERIFNDHVGNVIDVSYKPASYLEFGAGAKFDIFKLLGFSKPLEVSGSYKHSERSLETDNWALVGLVDETTTLKSDFINAGLYVQYLPRLGVNAGFQMINTEFVGSNQLAEFNLNFNKRASATLMKGSQMQWMVGLDYNIAHNAWLALNFGMISVSNEYNTGTVVAAGSADGVNNLPNYYDVTKDAGSYKHEFTQTVLEASVNVEF